VVAAQAGEAAALATVAVVQAVVSSGGGGESPARARATAHAARAAILGGKVAEYAKEQRDKANIPRGGGARAGEDQEVIDYIRASAARHHIDPDVAVGVARSEGLKGFSPSRGTWSAGSNDSGTSFGALQAHIHGRTPGTTAYGQGDLMLKAGIDPRQMGDWKKVIDWQLDYASRKRSWSEWHGWARHNQHAGFGYNAPDSASMPVKPGDYSKIIGKHPASYALGGDAPAQGASAHHGMLGLRAAAGLHGHAPATTHAAVLKDHMTRAEIDAWNDKHKKNAADHASASGLKTGTYGGQSYTHADPGARKARLPRRWRTGVEGASI
jgi:hypothetical protein